VTTLSKFLMLGLSIDEVIGTTTAAPARALRRAEQFGSLQVGMPADIALLRVEEGPVALFDSAGVGRTAPTRLVPVATLRAGRIPHAGTASPA